MKKPFLLLLFFMCFMQTRAQDWSLFRQNQKLNFSIDSSTIYETTWIDSVAVPGTDSVFYLNNKVLYPVDTNSYSEIVCRYQYSACLAQTITKKASGLYKLAVDTNEIYVFTEMGVGSSWIADTAMGINANVTAVSAQLIYGSPDSVKTIALSNGKIIFLSKSHGILKVDDLFGSVGRIWQIGNESTGQGLILPSFSAICAYHVGDVFEYYDTWGTYYYASPYYVYRKYTVTATYVSSDSVICYASYLKKESNYFGPWLYTSGYDTLVFTATMYPELAVYANDIMKKTGPFCGNYYKPLRTEFNSTFNTFCRMSEDHLSSHISGDTVYYGDWPHDGCYYGYTSSWGKGCGLIHSYSHYLVMPGDYSETTLLGYYNGTDTLGVLNGNVFYDGVDEVESFTKFNIFPNPATSTIHLDFSGAFNGNCEIANVSGKTVMKRLLNGEISADINVQELKSGIYFIRAGFYVKKLVIE